MPCEASGSQASNSFSLISTGYDFIDSPVGTDTYCRIVITGKGITTECTATLDTPWRGTDDINRRAMPAILQHPGSHTCPIHPPQQLYDPKWKWTVEDRPWKQWLRTPVDSVEPAPSVPSSGRQEPRPSSRQNPNPSLGSDPFTYLSSLVQLATQDFGQE